MKSREGKINILKKMCSIQKWVHEMWHTSFCSNCRFACLKQQKQQSNKIWLAQWLYVQGAKEQNRIFGEICIITTAYKVQEKEKEKIYELKSNKIFIEEERKTNIYIYMGSWIIYSFIYKWL